MRVLLSKLSERQSLATPKEGGSSVPEALPGNNIVTGHSTHTTSIMEQHKGNAIQQHIDARHIDDTATRNREQIRADAMGMRALHERNAHIRRTL